MAQNSAQTGFWQVWGFTTGLVVAGVVAGGYVGYRLAWNAERGHSSDVELQVISSTVQSGLQSALESIRVQALSIQGDAAPVRLPAMFRAWAEVEGTGLGLGAVRRSLQGPWRPSSNEAASLQLAVERARQENIGADRPGAIMVRPESDRLSEALWLVYPTGNASHATTVFAWVDAAEAFPLFARSGEARRGEELRIYLLSSASGLVLAHSTPSYIGTVFKNSPVHAAATGNSGVVETIAIDRIPVLAHYEPMSGLPWVIGVEKVNLAPPLNWNAGQGLELGGLAMALLALSLMAARSMSRQNPSLRQLGGEGSEGPMIGSPSSDASLESDFGTSFDLVSPKVSLRVPPPPSPAVLAAAARDLSSYVLAVNPSGATLGAGATLAGPIGTQINGRVVHAGPASGAFDGTRWQELRSEVGTYGRPLPDRMESDAIVTQFEKDALRLRDPREIAARMVQEATRLTGSPTLFFEYESRTKLAQLTVDAGLSADESPASLSFPIDESVFRHIVECGKRDELASLSDYPPLAQMIQARMGIGHFEAWAIAGYGPLGSRSGLPRLIGVFVLLQSGVDSYTRRDSLSKMLRATGLIYENSLHSRPNP